MSPITSCLIFGVRGKSQCFKLSKWELSTLLVAYSLGHVRLFATPWTVAQQAPLSMGFPSKNAGVGCYFLLWGIFLTLGLNLHLLHWQPDIFTTEPPGESMHTWCIKNVP